MIYLIDYRLWYMFLTDSNNNNSELLKQEIFQIQQKLDLWKARKRKLVQNGGCHRFPVLQM